MRHFLVDRIVEMEPKRRFTAVKTFPRTEDYLHYGFPRPRGEVPCSILLESIVQAASLFLGGSHDFAIKAVPVLVERAILRRPVHVGDRVTYRQEVLSQDGYSVRMRCRVLAAGAEVLEVSFVMGFGSPEGNWVLPVVDGQRRFFRALVGDAIPVDFVEEAWACAAASS
jgi:3-hydroxymyristoyl/3-hydroxydecanoyl-(acyl carrier protein) dehydratase